MKVTHRTPIIEPDGWRFRASSGIVVTLQRRRKLRLVLAALVHCRLERPGHVLSPSQLIEAGWPDERIYPRAARARLHVAVSSLRKLGLGDALEFHQGGYRLDPAVDVAPLSDAA